MLKKRVVKCGVKLERLFQTRCWQCQQQTVSLTSCKETDYIVNRSAFYNFITNNSHVQYKFKISIILMSRCKINGVLQCAKITKNPEKAILHLQLTMMTITISLHYITLRYPTNLLLLPNIAQHLTNPLHTWACFQICFVISLPRMLRTKLIIRGHILIDCMTDLIYSSGIGVTCTRS